MVYSTTVHCDLLDDTFDRYGTLIRKKVGVQTKKSSKKLRFSPDTINQIKIEVSKCELWPSDQMSER